MKKIVNLLAGASFLFFAGAGCSSTGIQLSEEQRTKNAEQVCAFLKDAKVYYIATVDGDQPQVRPFGTANMFEGKLYIQTARRKAVYKQIAQNRKVAVCAYIPQRNEWLRISGTLCDDDRFEAQESMLKAYPSLQKLYKAGDGNNQVLYFVDAKADFCSFAHPGKTLFF